MTVLILHRGAFAASPYERWLEGYPGDAVLLASHEQLAVHGEELPAPGGRFRHVEALPDYDTGPGVERRAAELVERYGVRRIVALQERDIARSAALRERYGLPGQRPDTVGIYRDKWAMKEAARAAGIPVARYALLRGPEDLAEFAAEHGLPVVVKPRAGAASIGLEILRTGPELAGYLARADLSAGADGEPGWLAESYVPGSMHHIDGTVLDGRIVSLWPSQYRYALADFGTDRSGRKDVALDPADPLAARLVEFGERVLDAFGGPEHFAFHIEVFVTPDGELVLCEAACRAGGAGIRDVHRVLFGFDPAEVQVRRQLGLGADELPAGRLAPGRLGGQLLLMRRPGTVHAVPTGVERFPWVVKHTLFAAVGDRLEAARHSSDFLAAFVVAAPDRATLDARLAELDAWCQEGFDIR
ncbi:NikS protein [Kitasatospora sp. NPDC059571]|uniref:ATP-binding protein n=1 Tax=Kitasatospora sp. NPDC059571 TaxID=3346871 RepID=UPI0036CDAEE0